MREAVARYLGHGRDGDVRRLPSPAEMDALLPFAVSARRRGGAARLCAAVVWAIIDRDARRWVHPSFYLR